MPISGPIDSVVDRYRVSKRLPMKADLAIYSLIVDMSGQWENVATMLNIKLDFCCCDNLVGFCKSGHIFITQCNFLLPLLLIFHLFMHLQSCAAQHAACVTITCIISNLRANESSTIRIEGFVDDATFMV